MLVSLSNLSVAGEQTSRIWLPPNETRLFNDTKKLRPEESKNVTSCKSRTKASPGDIATSSRA